MAKSPWEITRDMFLSEPEADGLLAAVRARTRTGPRRERLSAELDALIIECLLFSGLRNSEFCALRVENTILGTNESVFVVHGRRDKGRTVYVPEQVSARVVRFVEKIRPHLLPDGMDPNDYSQPLVFNDRRRPYERTGLYRRVVRILTDAGLGDRASVQLLRHTYGYLAYARTGGKLLFVQRQLGHAHPMVTSIYAQFVDESYSQVAEQVIVTTKHKAKSKRNKRRRKTTAGETR